MYKVFIWIFPRRAAKKRATAGWRFSLTRFVPENRTRRRENCKNGLQLQLWCMMSARVYYKELA